MQPLLKKVSLSFSPTPSLKIKVLSSPPSPFWKFCRRYKPSPHPLEKGGVHAMRENHFQPENKSIYNTNYHLWCLKFCHWGRWQETQAAVNREKSKERTRFLFNNPWVFNIFVLLPAIMKYLYDSAKYDLIVWVSFKSKQEHLSN